MSEQEIEILKKENAIYKRFYDSLKDIRILEFPPFVSKDKVGVDPGRVRFYQICLVKSKILDVQHDLSNINDLDIDTINRTF
jgi:hypothetical protein